MKLATIDRYHLQAKVADRHETAVTSPTIRWLRLVQFGVILVTLPAPVFGLWIPVVAGILAAILLQLVIVERVLVRMLKGWNE